MRRRRVLATLAPLFLAGCQTRLSTRTTRRPGRPQSSETTSDRTSNGGPSTSTTTADGHTSTPRASTGGATNATGIGTSDGSTNATASGSGNATSTTGANRAPRVSIRVENVSSKPANFGITVTHTSDPDCRYHTPACGASTKEDTVFDQAIAVGARAAAELGPVTVPLTANAVDLASVVATVKGHHATADGVEPGAKRVMGKQYDDNNYDWKLTPAKHVARVQYDGGVAVVTMESP